MQTTYLNENQVIKKINLKIQFHFFNIKLQ